MRDATDERSLSFETTPPDLGREKYTGKPHHAKELFQSGTAFYRKMTFSNANKIYLYNFIT